MHELAMCEAIARTVTDRAAGRQVVRVSVQIGHLRQVVPDALGFSWEMLTTGTELAGAALEVDHVPAVVVCGACGTTTTLDAPVLVCGTCDALDVELRSGDELTLVSFEVAAP
jgi:hydrogenase nickel incorporation protein HypA/HybF